MLLYKCLFYQIISEDDLGKENIREGGKYERGISPRNLQRDLILERNGKDMKRQMLSQSKGRGTKRGKMSVESEEDTGSHLSSNLPTPLKI